MRTSILITVILSLVVVGCSTTTYFNLKQTYPEYIENELKKVDKETGVGVEVTLLLKNADEVNGELLSVRDSTIILCSEYSAAEADLVMLTYPIILIPNYEIEELTIEGSNWVWEGVGTGFFAVLIPAIITGPHYDEAAAALFTGIVIWGPVIGGIAGYILSTEEYVMEEISPNYNWSILKLLSRYPDEEPEYLRAIE